MAPPQQNLPPDLPWSFRELSVDALPPASLVAASAHALTSILRTYTDGWYMPDSRDGVSPRSCPLVGALTRDPFAMGEELNRRAILPQVLLLDAAAPFYGHTGAMVQREEKCAWWFHGLSVKETQRHCLSI